MSVLLHTPIEGGQLYSLVKIKFIINLCPVPPWTTYYATRRSTTNSLHTPTLAAYTQLNGAFDFNKTPQLEQESSSMRSPACAKPGHHMVLMAGTSDQHQSTTGATNSTAPKQGMNASQTPYNSFHLTSRCHKCPPPMLP